MQMDSVVVVVASWLCCSCCVSTHIIFAHLSITLSSWASQLRCGSVDQICFLFKVAKDELASHV